MNGQLCLDAELSPTCPHQTITPSHPTADAEPSPTFGMIPLPSPKKPPTKPRTTP